MKRSATESGTGRPNLGAAHADKLEGGPQEKERLRRILETITGELSVSEACERLGLSPSRFDELRTRALEGALAALAPRPIGRPRKDGARREASEVRALRHTVAELEARLLASDVRVELVEAIPELAKRSEKRGPRGRARGVGRARR